MYCIYVITQALLIEGCNRMYSFISLKVEREREREKERERERERERIC